MKKTTDRKKQISKTIINIVVPVLITIAVIIIFFKEISLEDIITNFLNIPTSYLVGFLILSMGATVLRAYKYYILLAKKLSFRDVFLITLVRNFSVDLLPARTAALAFYSWLTRKKGISLEEGASSFVVSVFYDGLALSFMLGGLLFFLKTDIDHTAIYIAVGIIFVISVIMIFFTHIVTGFLLKIELIKKFRRLEAPLRNIDSYLKEHKSNMERLWLFLLSLAIRILKYVFIYLLFEGVVGIGFGLHSFSIFSFGLAGTEMSSLIPIQGIGGFGTWELAFAYIFKALAIPAENIKEAGFVIHITTQVWEYFIGLLAFLYLLIPVKKGIATEVTENTELK